LLYLAGALLATVVSGRERSGVVLRLRGIDIPDIGIGWCLSEHFFVGD